MHRLLLATFMLLLACSDPAVRVAESLERCTKRIGPAEAAAFRCECDPRLSGEYVVVLFPAREVSAAEIGADIPFEVAQRAVANRLITDVDSLHVLPLEGEQQVTRTTYQANFVVVPKPFARVIRRREFSLLLRRERNRIIVDAIE